MSVMQVTGYPGWAALSATGIKNLVLPPEALQVLIACDNDENHVGLKAARKAQRRWLAEGRRVRVSMPPLLGTDWNDVLAGRAPARIGRRRDAA
jgi:putative DNA primase/helicase